jgi:hypothetical protein
MDGFLHAAVFLMFQRMEWKDGEQKMLPEWAAGQLRCV